MRDPKRIPGVLAAVLTEWEKSPDLRLGQLIANASNTRSSRLFYMEDDQLIEALRALKLRHVQGRLSSAEDTPEGVTHSSYTKASDP